MNIREIMMKIEQEEIVVIQEEVRVEFDGRQQTPLGFRWRQRHYEVLQLLHVFKEQEHVNFLVLTSGGIFDLVLMQEDKKRGRWILKYKVKEESQFAVNNFWPKDVGIVPILENIFVPLDLANIVSYHGHLCPELVVGYRAGLIAINELNLNRQNAHNFFVMAENLSSAVDSLQYLTGCTIGNQNFYAYELGKHVYYFARFSPDKALHKALRIALVNPVVDMSRVKSIAQKIKTERAAHEEIIVYQKTIEEAVKSILNLPDELLFSKKTVHIKRPRSFFRHDYRKCVGCGEVVASFGITMVDGNPLCSVCAMKTP